MPYDKSRNYNKNRNSNDGLLQLEQDLKNGIIRNLYVFTGPEDYLIRYYLDILKSLILSNDGDNDINFTFLEGRQDSGSIIDVCNSYPVFANKKLVVIKNAGILKVEKKNKDKNRDRFLSFIKNLPDCLCLVIIEKNEDKNIKYDDEIKENGLIVNFSYKNNDELAAWMSSYSKKQNIKIEEKAIIRLLEISTQDINTLINEIEKLLNYCGDRVVSVDDVNKLCTPTVKSRSFDLVDACIEKNAPKALKILHELESKKEPAALLRHLIITQLKLLFAIKIYSLSTNDIDEACKKAKVLPFLIYKTARQAKSLTLEQIRELLYFASEMDLASKTGNLDEWIQIELLIDRLSIAAF